MLATAGDAREAVDVTACTGCGTDIPRAPKGRPRRWCTEECRRRGPNNSAGQTAGRSGAGTAPCRDGRDAGGAARGGPAQPGLPGAGEARRPAETAAHSRYIAKFADTAGQDTYSSVRKVRYRLRHLLRKVTTIDRCKACGWSSLGQGITVKRSVTNEGMALAGFGGIAYCGRIWLCPVCAAKIRLRRGDEIARGVANHIGAGGAALFATATLPHEHGDALLTTFDVLAKAWRYLTDSRAWKYAREHYGIVGTIKAVEVTHGDNGWHPHAHVVVLLSRALDFAELLALTQSLDATWARALVRQGWPEGLAPYRFRLDAVDVNDQGSGLAAYVAKVQDKGLGNEIARADLKKGRSGSRSPFEILADFGENALADDLELWWEYETATKGRSAIRWSRGLRALLLPDEKELTDDEIAAEEMGGELVAVLSASLWRRLRQDPDVVADVLAAVELLGWQGLIAVLTRHRIGLSGLYTPEEWKTPGAVELSP